MFSRLNFIPLTLILLALLLNGCDRFLHSGKSNSGNDAVDTVTIQTKDTACIAALPKNIQLFLDDGQDSTTGLEADVVKAQKALDESATCLSNSLNTFTKYTKGEAPDRYTAQEIQHFFNRYLLKKNQITDTFLAELMKLKVLVVGGVPETATRVEIQQLGEFVVFAKGEIQKLKGQMRLLSFRRASDQVADQDLRLIQDTSNEVLKNLIEKSHITTSKYEWSDFKTFMNELDIFVDHSQSLQALLKWVPLVESFKVLFIGENANLASDELWQYATRWSIDSYTQLLRYFYLIRHLNLDSASEWSVLSNWAESVLTGIQTSPAMRDQRLLQVDAIDRLIDEADALKLIRLPLEIPLIKETYRKVLTYIIEGKNSKQSSTLTLPGFTTEDLKIITQEFHVWKLEQQFISSVLGNGQMTSLPDLRAAANAYPIQKKISELQAETVEKEELTRSWSDFLKLLSNQPGVIREANNKMILATNMEKIPFAFNSGLLLGHTHILTRLALRGYGDRRSQALFGQGLSKERLADFATDFRALGIRVKFLDPRKADPSGHVFHEANLFTFHGNGDKIIDATEIFEEVNMILSGGVSVLTEVMRDMEISQCLVSQLDIFGNPMVKEDCFYKVFRTRFANYVPNLPGMVAFETHLSEKDYGLFYQGLLRIARVDQHINGLLERSEIQAMVTVLHYIDALFVVYDKNNNGHFSKDELLSAAPRFRSFISSISPLKDMLVDDIFLFLVYNGHKPSIEGIPDALLQDVTGGLSQGLSYIWQKLTHAKDISDIGRQNLNEIVSFEWQLRTGKDFYEVSRKELITVLGLLKESASAPAAIKK